MYMYIHVHDMFVLLTDNREEKEIFWRTSSTSDASNFHNYELIQTFTQGAFMHCIIIIYYIV